MALESNPQPPPFRLAGPFYALVLAFVLLLLVRGQVWTGAGVDEIYYYAQAVSPLWDGDLNFSNEMLESRNDYDLRTRMANELFLRGKPNFPFSFGMAYVSLPLSWATRALDGFSFWKLGGGDPYAWIHRAAPSLATWLLVLAGLLASLLTASRFTSPWRAFWLVLAVFLGTNLSYYTWHAPVMAHGASFGATALLLWASIRYAESPGWRRALLTGCLCGLAFLLRWQNALAALVPICAVIFNFLKRPQTRGETIGHTAILVAAGLLTALPQFVIWRQVFGSWMVVPQGGGFFLFDFSRPSLILFSPINGWIYTHPLIALLFLGFIIGPKWRDWLLPSIFAVLLLQVLVNSLPGDWWAGGAFGARRFTGATALLIVPGAMLLQRLRGLKLTLLGILSGLFVLLNLLVVARWVQAPAPRLFWPLFLERLPETIRLIAGQSDTLFASDLFSDPRAVDHRGFVRAAMLLIALSLGAGGVVLIAFRQRSKKFWPLLEIGTASVFLLLTCLSTVMLAKAGRGEDQILADWSRQARGLEGEERRVLAAEFAEDQASTIPLAPTVYRLEHLLHEGRFDEADILSAALAPAIPKTVLDCWLRIAEPGVASRSRWTDDLADQLVDLPLATLDGLFANACRLRDEPRLDVYHDRAGGAHWLLEARRFEREYWKASAAPELRKYLHDALDANPFWLHGQLEMLRLRAAAKRADDYYRRVDHLSREALALAEHVAAWLPEHHAAFEPEWRNQLTVKVRALEELGRADEIAGLLDQASGWGLTEEYEKQLRVELEWLREHEQQIAEGDMLRFPGDDAVAGTESDWLWPHDGWRLGETSADGMYSWTWSTSEVAFVRLNAPLPQGEYFLRANLASLSAAHSKSAMKVDIYGRGEQDIRFSPKGDFHYRWRIHVTEEIERPVVRIHHPLMSLDESDRHTNDSTRVGLCLFDMWVVPVEPD